MGKTALVKEYIEVHSEEIIWYAIKAREFVGKVRASDIFASAGQLPTSDFISAHNDESRKLFIIDSSEGLVDLDDFSVFQELNYQSYREQMEACFITRPYFLGTVIDAAP